MPQFAYAQSPLDRMSHLRIDAAEVEKRKQSAAASFIWVHGDGVEFAGDRLRVSAPVGGTPVIFLGADLAGKSWFAVFPTQSDSLKPIRSVMIEGLLPPEELSIIAQARSLVHWHDTHGFCAVWTLCRAGRPFTPAGRTAC